MDDPSRHGGTVTSLGEHYIQETLTDGEQAFLADLGEMDKGSTYEDLTDALDYDDEVVAGYLGSLAQKDILTKEEYTQDDIDRLAELNEEHSGLLHVDEDVEGYEDLLTKQGGIYTRGRGIHVDEETPPGTHFYLTEHGKDIRRGLE